MIGGAPPSGNGGERSGADRASRPWHPITDYGVPPESLSKPELSTLSQLWRIERQALAESRALETFNEQLRREWSIETGLIERTCWWPD